jgi:hypothetical protein
LGSFKIYLDTLCEGSNQYHLKVTQNSEDIGVLDIEINTSLMGHEKFSLEYFVFHEYAKVLFVEVLKNSNYLEELVLLFIKISFFLKLILIL